VKLPQVILSHDPAAPQLPPTTSPIAKYLYDLNLTDACHHALKSFNGISTLILNRLFIECEQAGVIRAEVLEEFYYLGLFDLDSGGIDGK
jgi:hypothetical protein